MVDIEPIGLALQTDGIDKGIKNSKSCPSKVPRSSNQWQALPLGASGWRSPLPILALAMVCKDRRGSTEGGNRHTFAALKSFPAAAYGTLEAVFSFAGSCSCKILCIYTISAKSCYCGRMDGRLAVPSGSAYPGRLGMN